MGLKDISTEDLESIHKAIKLFEFYGVTEEMIKEIPTIFATVYELKQEVNRLHEKLPKNANDGANIVDVFAASHPRN